MRLLSLKEPYPQKRTPNQRVEVCSMRRGAENAGGVHRMGRHNNHKLNAASMLNGILLVGSPQALLLHRLVNGAYSDDV